MSYLQLLGYSNFQLKPLEHTVSCDGVIIQYTLWNFDLYGSNHYKFLLAIWRRVTDTFAVFTNCMEALENSILSLINNRSCKFYNLSCTIQKSKIFIHFNLKQLQYLDQDSNLWHLENLTQQEDNALDNSTTEPDEKMLLFGENYLKNIAIYDN